MICAGPAVSLMSIWMWLEVLANYHGYVAHTQRTVSVALIILVERPHLYYQRIVGRYEALAWALETMLIVGF